MPFVHRRRSWQLRGLLESPERRCVEWQEQPRASRRELLRQVLGGVATAASSVASLSIAAVATGAAADEKKKDAARSVFPAKRNEQFKLDRPLTDEKAAGRYNNFYEFTETKRVTPYVQSWELGDWKLEVTGLVEHPVTLTMDELARRFPHEERLYRHRCVETWAMAVPWTGFPLKKLLDDVQPRSSAKYVKFVSFDHAKVKGARRKTPSEPWPYTEGISIAEASNDLAMLVTGIFGHALPKQHGPPVRLVMPWKYGFKSAKSLVRIEFVANRPATFWNTLVPEEYDFVANVDPKVSHPRWSQATEWDIGTRERRPTQLFNGYGELVAKLYPS